MEINTQALTMCEVAADGGAVSLGFVDANGKPATIRLSINQVGALAMTLPGLIDKALQKRFGDQSLRYAYPLESWMVEQSTDPTQSMVTLRTRGRLQRLLLDPAPAAERTRRGAGGAAGDEGSTAGALRSIGTAGSERLQNSVRPAAGFGNSDTSTDPKKVDIKGATTWQ